VAQTLLPVSITEASHAEHTGRSAGAAAKKPKQAKGMTERFTFQKLHGELACAAIALARFVNGDDVR